MKSFVGSLLFALVLVGCGGGGGGGSSNGQAFGLDGRATPSAVQIPVSPRGSTSLRAVDAGLGNQFGTTTLTNAGDGSDRLFLARADGVINVIHSRGATPQTSEFLDIRDRVDSASGEGGLLGLAFDPAYHGNGYFYVYYVHCPLTSCSSDGQLTVRISRFRDSSRGANSASVSSETILREIPHPARSHYAGWLGFGPDGMLYISRGDGEDPSAPQDRTKLFGKILRVQVNNSANRLDTPSDNPFGNEVWAMGFRNPFRCSFDRGTGDLWCGDVGQGDREEVNRVRRGGNYGWPVYEGDLPFSNPNNLPYSAFDAATYFYPHNVGVAVIGGYVYRGPTLTGIVGRYVFGDYVSSNLWAITTNGSGAFTGISVGAVMPDSLTIQAIGEDEAGELYAAPPSGPIIRFEADGGAPGTETQMPPTLSETGLFSDTAALTPAPGLIDYAVNAPFWSNGAQKRRWFRLPGTQTIGFSESGNWTFPVGTITVKHFDLGSTRVETRVMVKRTDGWRGFTYKWRSDRQDADLVDEGGASDVYNGQTWNFPSRNQCLQCHTVATGHALGLNTRQFNGDHTYAATGRGDNQLRALNHIGIFSSDIGAASQYSSMPNPADANSGTIEARARSYLDTNCSICHQPGGGTPVNMDLRYATSLADMKIFREATSQTNGGTRVVPGNPGNSDLWQRVQSSDGNRRMPPVGVQVVDQEAVQLLSTWITGLQ